MPRSLESAEDFLQAFAERVRQAVGDYAANVPLERTDVEAIISGSEVARGHFKTCKVREWLKDEVGHRTVMTESGLARFHAVTEESGRGWINRSVVREASRRGHIWKALAGVLAAIATVVGFFTC